MAGLCDYAENKVLDAVLRNQTLGAPTTHYVALISLTKGAWAASTAFSLNDTILATSASGNRIYKVTTAGTTGSSAPTWPTAFAGTVVDGTVTWTEQTQSIEAGTFTEVSGGSYARIGVASSLANFAGTQSAGSTTASSGTNASTSNNGAINYTTPTANWGYVGGYVTFDALTSGNPWCYGYANSLVYVGMGATVSFAAGAFTFYVDNA
jgi:hypothetical protein